jgi:hypothetical protein
MTPGKGAIQTTTTKMNTKGSIEIEMEKLSTGSKFKGLRKVIMNKEPRPKSEHKFCSDTLRKIPVRNSFCCTDAHEYFSALHRLKLD